jgi:hypothetical protein
VRVHKEVELLGEKRKITIVKVHKEVTLNGKSGEMAII